MMQQYRHGPIGVLSVWFGALSFLAIAVVLIGPAAARPAMIDRSAGLFITYGSIYSLIIIFAVTCSLMLLEWRIDGLQRIFEFGESAGLSESVPVAWRGRFFRIAGYAMVFLGGLYFMFVSLGGTLVSTMEHDAFVFFDGVQHLVSGRCQHIDFHTPMGQLCNLLPYWGYILSGRFAGAMEWGCLLAGIYFMTIGAYVLSTRYTIGLAFPVVMFLCLLTVVPMGVDSPPEMITTAMFYNRLGWTALTIILLFYLEPRKDVSRHLWLDSAMLSGLLLFLFYLKISYALVALAFMSLLLFDSQYNRQLVLATLGISAAIIASLEAAFGFHGAYLLDIRDTLKASGANRGSMIPKLFANIREYLMATFAVIVAYSSAPKRWNYLIFMGFVFASGLAIIDQNTHYRGVISLIAVFAVAQEICRRKLESEPLASLRGHIEIAKAESYWSLACLGLLLAFVVQPITYGWTATTMIRSAVVAAREELPQGLGGVVFSCYENPILEQESLSKPRRNSDLAEARIGQEYIKSVLDGAEILKASGIADKSVMTLDFVNPFSFLLAMKPAIGDHTCVHYGRTMNDGITPSPEDYLGQADYVMVPLKPKTPPTADFLWRTYRPYIEKEFDKSAATEYWVLWKRISTNSKTMHVSATRQTNRSALAK
jgi:hypothetical protein